MFNQCDPSKARSRSDHPPVSSASAKQHRQATDPDATIGGISRALAMVLEVDALECPEASS